MVMMIMISRTHSFTTRAARGRYSIMMSSSPPSIKEKLAVDMKDAMKTKQKEKLTAIRAILSAIKQKEVDDQTILDDEAAIGIMSKLVKRGKESIKSYQDAGRQDLVEKEQIECDFIVG